MEPAMAGLGRMEANMGGWLVLGTHALNRK
jgi:hypothetical protein